MYFRNVNIITSSLNLIIVSRSIRKMDNGAVQYDVIVLFNGYSKLNATNMKANCTCTLLKGLTPNSPHIIVDTMTAWDGDRIKRALNEKELDCDNIEYVICTHGHSDHIGCNYLFPNAKFHIVGYSISNKDVYELHDFTGGQEYIINEKVKVIPTPGHTLQCISVIVQTRKGLIAVTGDLFEKEEDLEKPSIWQAAGSDSEKLQILNRNRILLLADWIIPGHGPMFRVSKHSGEV